MKGEGLPYCLDCRKPVRWVLNARNKWVSIDPEPVEDRTGNLHGLLAITGDDPPAVRYLWNDMQPEDHESLYASHHDTCPERPPNAAARVRAGGQGRPPETARARALREKRKAADKGYEPGLLSGQPGPCALCHRVTELVTDHCHRHRQNRDEVCPSCNSQIAKADAAFWRGDIAEIHVAHLDHLRRCERCAQELDHLLKE
jgi:Recombination endonuclease VII